MSNSREAERKPCCEDRCPSPIQRRQFLGAVGLAAVSSLLDSPAATAGPFEAADFTTLVPHDKKLQAEWVKSLFERGEPEVYRGEALRWIGMPIGGICAGQLYLGGDGSLWHWDIFNRHIPTGAEHYASPMQPSSPLEQGFAVRLSVDGKLQTRVLDRRGFSEIAFRGEYPLGQVDFRDSTWPVSIQLVAYSPFIPLNAEDSSLPVTILEYTVKNPGAEEVQCELGGWLENAVGLHSGATLPVTRRLEDRLGAVGFEHAVEELPEPKENEFRPEIRFEDFEKETYEGWTAEGTAFGAGPIAVAKMAGYQGDVAGQGARVVNTHNVRQGEDVVRGDAHVGTLTSRPFTIERNYIRFLIGGGAHKGRTCLNLAVDGQVVLSATGANDNRMQAAGFDVRRWRGREAQLQIVDQERGGWGNIGVDDIVFTDRPAEPQLPLRERPDYGSMGLMVLGEAEQVTVHESLPAGPLPQVMFTSEETKSRDKPCGAVVQRFTVEPQGEHTVRFALAWHFPNQRLPRNLSGHQYATRFPSLRDVVTHLARHHQSFAKQTRLWRDTWYDSSLPYWFLDRTMAPTASLATSTCHWLANGRFYGWEGVGCCEGTCTHVWHYAHAVARLFPQLERSAREMADFGVAFDAETGLIGFRGEAHRNAAIDGQAGCILRSYREHQMSAEDSFLRRNWPRIRKALEFLIAADANSDGIIEGQQHNTLDADWYGPVAWLSGLYLAALLAGERMSEEMGDKAFAARVRGIFETGRKRIVERLWNGEYFVNQPDPQHPDAINSGTGCHIDQVFGQSWAYQVGLERVFDERHARGALQALWNYNFTPDVGPYRAAMKPGRWYAMPGEGGLLMCTFPQADWSFEDSQGKGNTNPGFAGYFNECMNGFEYQVAGHMLWEGMLTEGLAITRMIHDRYHALRRNPWNEVECGDHYARSMASYGVYLAACGFEYHGPQGHIGIAPRLSPDDFRSAFTAAEGWGTIRQRREEDRQVAYVAVQSGRVRLRTVALAPLQGITPGRVTVTLGGRGVAARLEAGADRLLIVLNEPIVVEADQILELAVTA